MSTRLHRRAYVQAVLTAYLALPDTLTQARPPDRRLASQFYDRAIPLATVQDAFLLATSRRLLRDEELPPLSPIRSLYYFLPVVEELLESPLPNGYTQYLERKLRAHHKGPRRDGRWEKPLTEVRPAAPVQKSSDPRDR